MSTELFNVLRTADSQKKDVLTNETEVIHQILDAIANDPTKNIETVADRLGIFVNANESALEALKKKVNQILYVQNSDGSKKIRAIFSDSYSNLAGGQGSIFRAYEPQLDRVVAAKKSNVEMMQDGRPASREARLQAKIDHDSVMTVHNIYVDNFGSEYLIMPFIDQDRAMTTSDIAKARFTSPEGVSLDRPRSFMETTQLSLSQIADITEKLGSAIDASILAGAPNRDIKPSNVMLTLDPNNPRLVLIDWGSSSDDPSDRKDIGTPNYIAQERTGFLPEQTFDEAKSELFSFAMTLYEIFTAYPLNSMSGNAIDKALINLFTGLVDPKEENDYALPSELRSWGLNEEEIEIICNAFTYAIKFRPEDRTFTNSTEFAQTIANVLKNSSARLFTQN